MPSLFRPLPLRLLALALAASLPVALFAVGALYLLAADKRAVVERSMVETVRAVAGAMDGELQKTVSVVEALATADALARGDIARFYELCQRVLKTQPAWITLSLAEPSGRYIFNLQRPLGAPLPATMTDLAVFEEIRRTGRPVIGGIFLGKVSGQPLFTVRVPVILEGELRYVISAAVRPEAMLAVISRQQIPEEGIVAIIDPSDRIVARSRRQEEFVGKPITPDLREAIATRGEGFASLMTLDGQRTYAAFSRSNATRWAVAFGVPADVLDVPMRTSYLLLAAGVLLSLLAGAAAAALFTRRIARPVQELAVAATAIGRGQQPQISRSRIPELDTMGQALAAAGRARLEAEEARSALLEREREARAAAEAQSRLKDEFLAMLGHELRNPLNAISTGVQVLVRARDAQTLDTVLPLLERQARHLARLLDDLLQVSRVIVGKIELERTPVDLHAIVRDVIATLEHAGRLKDHRLSVHGEACWVEADPHRMSQVVANILDNAVKYTPAGGAIEVSVGPRDDAAILRVRDSGVGMAPGLVPRVFDLFVQGDRSLARDPGGLGIGLTLVRRLVELHGGRVEATSEGRDRGSEFIVRLPRIAPRPAAAAPAETSTAKPRRVLVIEDNDDNRLSLRRLLELQGHEVLEAATGPEGVERALAEQPDLALIDIGLPGFDGYECARRIRAAPAGARMRLVAVTGYGSEADQQRARQAGFDLHLTKPLTPHTLAAALGATAGG